MQGLSGVPTGRPGRPVLLIGNHQLFAPDMPLMVVQFLKEKGCVRAYVRVCLTVYTCACVSVTGCNWSVLACVCMYLSCMNVSACMCK